jgi:ADP-ribose pyrophosphatase YjhB (NUDIX family)
VRDGRALVTIRAREPERGKVDVPGGFLQAGEHPVDGVVREVREELGVEVSDVTGPEVMAAHTYGPGGKYVLALGFAARLMEGSGEPRPADDVAEAKWVSCEEVEALDFAWEHDRNLIRKALENGKGEPCLRWTAG